MTIKSRLLFLIIQIQRYIFKRKFISIFGKPLNGYKWSTNYNYEYITGDYEEKNTLDIFCSWLNPTTVFYDLGANVGYYAFIANQYISNGKIYSFEPMPANIDIFNRHLQLNAKRMKNNSISLLPYAISDKEKEVAFSNNDKAIEGNTYVNSKVENVSSKSLMVKCFSVDGLLRSGYKNPDVIKIDVEGAEYDVLRGAMETLKQYKPNILLATHDCHLPGVQKLCVDLLQELGYELTVLSNANKIIAGLDDYIAIHKDSIKLPAIQ